ncbi:MAG: hypothetical protein V3U23_06765 [Kiloniellales bacterium]
MYKGLYAYAWDLADEGLENALARIRPTGVNTITLAASYHAGKFLRPHGQAGKVYFPEDGTVYFQPRPERYGVIKPIVNPLVAEHDMLAALEREAPDLDRVAWVVCLHNTPLGRRHPEYVVRNAYGDPYYYNLCPAYEEVRAFVVNLCADLADRYELSGLALETPGWLPFDHGFHHEFAMVPLNRWAKWLLGLCFSEGSRKGAKAAGLDVDSLQAETRAALERFLADDIAVPEAMAAEWLIADLIADSEWTAFLNWRCRLVADLVAEVKAALPKETRLAVIPTVQRPTAACWAEGSDVKMLAEAADALEVPAYQATAEEVFANAWDVRRRAGDDARLHFILRPSFPDLANGTETAAAALRLTEVGLSGIAFYNYGHIRLKCLGRVREALAALETTGKNP